MPEEKSKQPIFPKVNADLALSYRTSGFWLDRFTDDYLVQAERNHGEQIAIIDEHGQTSYRELFSRAGHVASSLQALGITKGDVVSWILPNQVEASIIHHAITRLGAVSNPIVPIYRHREVGYILRQSESALVIAPRFYRNFDYAEMLSELKSELPDIRHTAYVENGVIGSLEDPSVSQTSFDLIQPVRSCDDPILLLYTSGTTANPKGVVHTHNSLDFENRSMIDFYGLSGNDVVYMPSPVTHVTGLLYGILLPPMIAITSVFQDRFDVEKGLQLMKEHRATFTVGSTPFLHGLSSSPSASPSELFLKTFVCGGADVPAELILSASINLGCTATRAYGSTEFPTVTGGTHNDSLKYRSETDGRLFKHVGARVVDEQGNEVGPGMAGELLVRGPESFIGYLNTSDSVDEEGWSSTGDLVTIDINGYLTVVGRKKDIIIRGGENISVKEIEDLLFTHPGVNQVAIVAMPDPILVERACAFVIANQGFHPTLDELCNHLRNHRLALQKLPERLEIVSELPMTASGKIQKHVLRTRIREVLEKELKEKRK